jgi:hypothetical protein
MKGAQDRGSHRRRRGGGESGPGLQEKATASAGVSTGQATGGVRDRLTSFARGRERRGEGRFASREARWLRTGLAAGEADRSCGLDIHRARTRGRVTSNGGLAWFCRPRRLRSSRIQQRSGFGRAVLGCPRGAFRSATRQSHRRDEGSCASSGTRRGLETTNDPESAQRSSRLQKSVRGALHASDEESREANQARAG